MVIYRIDTNNHPRDMITITVNGRDYSFSLISVDESRYEWLGEVLSGHMQTVHDRAVAKTKKEMRGLVESVKDFLE